MPSATGGAPANRAIARQYRESNLSVSIKMSLASTLAIGVLATSLAAAPAEARNVRRATAGMLRALALGALAASAPNNRYGFNTGIDNFYGHDCWWQRQWVYDHWDNVRYYLRTRTCN